MSQKLTELEKASYALSSFQYAFALQEKPIDIDKLLADARKIRGFLLNVPPCVVVGFSEKTEGINDPAK